jgi:hypothetical protein
VRSANVCVHFSESSVHQLEEWRGEKEKAGGEEEGNTNSN